MDNKSLMAARIAAVGGSEKGSNTKTLQSHFAYYAPASPGYKEFLIDDAGIFVQSKEVEDYPLNAEFSSENAIGILFTGSSTSTTEFNFQSMQNMNIGTMLWFNHSFWLVKERNLANDVLITGKVERCNKMLKFEDCGNYYTIPYYVQKSSLFMDSDEHFIYADNRKTLVMAATAATKKLKVNKRLMGETFGDGIPQCWSIVTLHTDEDLLFVSVTSSPFNKFTDNIELGLCDWNRYGKLKQEPETDLSQTLDYGDGCLFTQVAQTEYEALQEYYDRCLFVRNTILKINPSLINGDDSILKDTDVTYAAVENVEWVVEFVGGDEVGAVVSKTDTSITVRGFIPGKYIVITAKTVTHEYKKQILIKNL